MSVSKIHAMGVQTVNIDGQKFKKLNTQEKADESSLFEIEYNGERYSRQEVKDSNGETQYIYIIKRNER